MVGTCHYSAEYRWHREVVNSRLTDRYMRMFGRHLEAPTPINIGIPIVFLNLAVREPLTYVSRADSELLLRALLDDCEIVQALEAR